MRISGVGAGDHLGDAVRDLRRRRDGDGDGHHDRDDLWPVVPVRRPSLRHPLPAARVGRLPRRDEHVRVSIRLLLGIDIPAARGRAADRTRRGRAIPVVRLRERRPEVPI